MFDCADTADQAALPPLLQKNSKFMSGVCYSMTKSLTLLGDGSYVDTRAHHGTIFVTGSNSKSWALDAPNRPPVRACNLAAPTARHKRMSCRRIGVMDRDDF